MKKIVSLLTLFLLFLQQQGIAQEEFIEPPSRFLTRIPFTQLTGGIVILPGQTE